VGNVKLNTHASEVTSIAVINELTKRGGPKFQNKNDDGSGTQD
jgi:hypothetical protein